MILDIQFDSSSVLQSEIQNPKSKIAAGLYLPDPSHFSPPYPGVVVCHGLGSCKENHEGFARYLAEQGMAVLTFDFRGHGASEGELDEHTGDDVLAALDLLASRPEVDSKRLALRGSSMGALFALRAAASDRRVRAVAAIAPAVDIDFAQGLESGYLQHMIAREQMNVRLNVPSFVRALVAQNSRSVVADLRDQALLLIQCRGDEVVPFQWTEELLALAHEPKKMLLLEGGHHRFAQEDESVHQATYRWFRQALSQ